MDFFQAQDDALRRSRRLVLLFALAVVSMIAIVYLAVLVALGATVEGPEGAGLVHFELLAVVAGGMLLVIGGGTAARTAQLRKGGPAVAELLGGRRIDAATRDADERRLWNVVEEMSIASGTPVPAVYVLPGEEGINAFAAGHSIHDAAVAVTRGALERLSRDELQGVVAHEFSHILNGDMRLNVRLIGLLFGILLLTVVGRGLLRGGAMRGGGRGRGGGGGQVAIIGLLLIVLGYLGVLFGRIIQAAVSRQREFLADAAAVRFTRSPDGIAGALKKIAEDSRGSVVTDHHAQEVGHLFFANGVTGALSSAFSTHPPLEERIRRIDSSGDGRIETSPPRPSREGPAERKKGGAARRPTGVELPLAAAIVATAGAPGPDHVAYARNLLERMDEELRTRLRSPEGAVAVVIALLLSDEEDVRTLQSAAATEILGPESVETASLLRPKVAELGPSGRLPVLDLALPALRQLSAERSAALRRAVRPLVRADGRIRTFDFALFHVLWQAVPAGEDRRPGGGRKDVPLSRLRDEVERLLSAMARSGADDESAARRAFDAGAARLGKTGAPWALRPEGELDLEHVDRALSRLESASPAVKKALLEAAGEVVRFDGRARVAEVEMLRAVAEALDAPMPPVLTPANGREADGS